MSSPSDRALAFRYESTERAHCYAIARGEALECGTLVTNLRGAVLSVVPDTDLVHGKQLVVRIVEMLTKMCR